MRVSLAIGRVPPNVEKFVMFVSRVKVFDEETGTCVRKISADLSAFKPSGAFAVVSGNVPSGRKFRNEANTRLEGLSDAS